MELPSCSPDDTFSVQRSLAKDANDAKIWHSVPIARNRSRPASYFPYFFNADHMPLWLNHAHTGETAFLLAGGPSARLLDLSKLSSCWTMTLNNAHVGYRGDSACVVDDPSRFSLSLWLDPKIMKFVPLSHFDKPLWDNRLLQNGGEGTQKWERTELKLSDCPNVVGYRRNEKFHAPRWLHEETINWGNHASYGGGRSVMLAALRILYILGFRRVYLVGVDLEMSETKHYHFDEARTSAAIRGNVSTYAKLRKWFAELQPLFVKAGFFVFNCNPKSRLTAFPHVPFGEAVDSATRHLGDFTRERTLGMYQKLEDKCRESSKTVPPGDESAS